MQTMSEVAEKYFPLALFSFLNGPAVCHSVLVMVFAPGYTGVWFLVQNPNHLLKSIVKHWVVDN